METIKTVKEPLFHVIKRGDVSLARKILVRVAAIISGLLLGSVICWIVYGTSPFVFIKYLIKGNFNPFDNFLELVKRSMLLLMIGLALIPPFTMKFWNLGGNGQILMGGLVTIICMKYLGGTMPDGVVWIIMLLSSVIMGAIWAVIPAIFKAFFKTNETLFTLMMNYIAAGIMLYAIKKISGVNTTGTIGSVETARLPVLGHQAVLVALIAIIVTVFITLYMKYSKHGYEVALVGDSPNTAKYGGINVKTVVIRTLVLSGAICGLVGLLLVGSVNYTLVTEETMAKSGFTAFTAIIAVWIAHNNPLATIGVSFGIMFLNNGMEYARTNLNITEEAIPSMIIGLIYLVVIACEFFITYKLKFNGKNTVEKANDTEMTKEDK